MNNKVHFPAMSRLLPALAFASIILAPGQLLAATGGDAVIRPESQKQLIDRFFFDFKSPSAASMVASNHATYNATNLFTKDGFNGIRTSIYGTRTNPQGDAGKPAHPSPGVVVGAYYADEVSGLKKALAVNPDLVIFASKKLNGDGSFPTWVLSTDKNGDGVADWDVNPTAYAGMLIDYLEYMADRDIPTHVLGIDNEQVYNEGNIIPSRFRNVIDQLTSQLATRNATRLAAGKAAIPMPITIGPDDYGPNKADWLKNIENNAWGDRLGIYGTHYYPHLRDSALPGLEKDLGMAGTRERWHTELHWNTRDGADDFDELEPGIGSLWDCTDRGMNGYVWWDYAREEDELRGSIMRRMTTRLLKSRPVYMDDIDGDNILTHGLLQTRAFRKGNLLYVFAINISSSAYANHGFVLNTGSIAGDVTYHQWVDLQPTVVNNNPAFGTKCSFTTGNAGTTNSSRFAITLPERSVTAFSVPYAPPPRLHLSETWEPAPAGSPVAGAIQADERWSVINAGHGLLSVGTPGLPLAGKALRSPQSATATSDAILRSTLRSPIRADVAQSITVRAKGVFQETDATANDWTKLSLLSTGGDYAYSLEFRSNPSSQAPTYFRLIRPSGNLSVTAGSTGSQVDGGAFEMTATFLRQSNTQTRVDYNVYRNGLFWKQGTTTLAGAMPTGTILDRMEIATGNQAGIKLDDLSVLSDDTTPLSAPATTSHPASQTINLGATATFNASVTGTPPLYYQWYSGTSGDTSTPIGGATASAYTSPALSAWKRYWVRVTNALGSADSQTALAQVAGGSMTFADWVSQPGVPTAQASALGTPANDGIANLTKYALGVHPTASAAHRLPQPATGGTPLALGVVYTANVLATGLSTSLETSTNMTAWNPVATTSTILSTNADGTKEIRLLETTPPASGARRFARLRFTLAP